MRSIEGFWIREFDYNPPERWRSAKLGWSGHEGLRKVWARVLAFGLLRRRVGLQWQQRQQQRQQQRPQQQRQQ